MYGTGGGKKKAKSKTKGFSDYEDKLMDLDYWDQTKTRGASLSGYGGGEGGVCR